MGRGSGFCSGFSSGFSSGLGGSGALRRASFFIGERVEQQVGLEVEVASERLADGAWRAARAGAGTVRRSAAGALGLAHLTPIPSFSRKARYDGDSTNDKSLRARSCPSTEPTGRPR